MAMQNHKWVVVGLLALVCCGAWGTSDFQILRDDFVKEFPSLKIPDLVLSYRENLEKIQNWEGIARQEEFYQRYSERLKTIPLATLNDDERIAFGTMDFFIASERIRVQLEKRFRREGTLITSDDGLFQVPHGREWYRYFVERWTATRVNPRSLVAFGESEVVRVQKEIKRLQIEAGYAGKDQEFYHRLNSLEFLITDQSVLQNELETFRAHMESNLSNEFDPVSIPQVAIKPIPNPTKDSPPGYYEDNTFYYKFFNNRFNRRALQWLFIHEAIPGHHYQLSLNPKVGLEALTWFPGFTEGWGAYVENLGKNLGAYQQWHEELGKWEWDLVRSVRVVLDVRINFFGWSKVRALRYWKQQVKNLDELAEREVDRMFRWPAQVLSYKVGEREFLRLRNECQTPQRFHSIVLKRGSLPLPVLNEVVRNECH